MDAIRTDVEKLVVKELDNANKTFPQFHSNHEGYAVMLEELNESKSALQVLDYELNSLWRDIQANRHAFMYEEKAKIKTAAIDLAVEAIQVAAMAEKFKVFIERGGTA